PLAGLALWWLVIKGSYRRVEKIFLIMSLGFLAYIPAAFASHPVWSDVGRQLVSPQVSGNSDYISGYLLTAVALVGTTISPYMQFFVQSSVADKGIHAGEYFYEQLDVYTGTAFAVLIAGFVIVTTGATLYPKHPASKASSQVSSFLVSSLPLFQGYQSFKCWLSCRT